MKILIAMDSFKGSLSSLEAGRAVEAGVRRADPAAETIVRPLADGGEGTVEALVAGTGGTRRRVRVTGPLGEPVDCVYGILPDGATAVIEMAEAAGLPLVPPDRRNPMETTTYGVGQLIRDAVGQGCRRFLVGIGGSATNDGGAGMLQALGFGLLDAQGRQIPLGARGLAGLASVERESALSQLDRCSFRVACDVTNPLCGPTGCSAVFGPQKGADPEMIRQMDGWLERYAALVRERYPAADPDRPGTGAAGGLGFAFLTFLNARLESGVGIVLEEGGIGPAVETADLVFTGEGRLDGQTAMGKAPSGVAGLAKRWGKPVVALAGSIGEGAEDCHRAGIDAFFPILRRIGTLDEAMRPETAAENLAATAEQAFRLWKAGRKR